MARWAYIWVVLMLLVAPAAPRRAAAGGIGSGHHAAVAEPAGGVVGNGTSGSCNDGTLHAALAGGGLITFDCGGPKTIAVASVLSITANTTIAGAGIITLTGGMSTRLFDVGPGVALALDGLVLDNAYGAGGHGGAIASRGALTLTASTIQNSLTDVFHAGGAIYAEGPLIIVDSVLTGNRAGVGGAIYAPFSTSQVTIINSRFSGNYTTDVSEGFGGAIYLGEGAHLSMLDGLLLSNNAVAGGALYMSRETVVALDSSDDSHPPCHPLAGESPSFGQACLLGPQLEGPPNYPLLEFYSNGATRAGGAIFNGGGTLTASGIELFNNIAVTTTDSYGGGIANYGTLNLLNTYLFSNAAAHGGGLYAGRNQGAGGAAAVVVDDSYLAANTADLGGGVYTDEATVVLTVTDTLFNHNLANTAGGGLFRYNARLNIGRSSFVLNEAAIGGALLSSTQPATATGVSGVVVIRDTTISNNSASFLAGGVFNADLLNLTSVTLTDNGLGLYTSSDGETHLRSSVLRNALANCSGDHLPIDDSYNYATDTSCGFTVSTQGNGLDPLLGPFVGSSPPPTYFRLPQPGSPLINQGAPDCATLDQRGWLRENTCDIGAIEADGVAPRWYLPLVFRN